MKKKRDYWGRSWYEEYLNKIMATALRDTKITLQTNINIKIVKYKNNLLAII